jgi:diketogulonate reductase-like aldo/keto reductase
LADALVSEKSLRDWNYLAFSHIGFVRICHEKNIAVVAYSPLGSPQSTVLTDPRLVQLAESKGESVTVANLLISWGVTRGYGVIPNTVSPTFSAEQKKNQSR